MRANGNDCCHTQESISSAAVWDLWFWRFSTTTIGICLDDHCYHIEGTFCMCVENYSHMSNPRILKTGEGTQSKHFRCETPTNTTIHTSIDWFFMNSVPALIRSACTSYAKYQHFITMILSFSKPDDKRFGLTCHQRRHSPTSCSKNSSHHIFSWKFIARAHSNMVNEMRKEEKSTWKMLNQKSIKYSA